MRPPTAACATCSRQRCRPPRRRSCQDCPNLLGAARGTSYPQAVPPQQKLEIVLELVRGDKPPTALPRARRRSHYDHPPSPAGRGRRARRADRQASTFRLRGQAPDPRAGTRARAQDDGAGDPGGSVAAVGVSERARIGRSLTVVKDPATGARRFPTAAIAKALKVSRQALYRRPARADTTVVRGPWPDFRPLLTDGLVIEAHVLDACRDRRNFGARRVTAAKDGGPVEYGLSGYGWTAAVAPGPGRHLLPARASRPGLNHFAHSARRGTAPTTPSRGRRGLAAVGAGRRA